MLYEITLLFLHCVQSQTSKTQISPGRSALSHSTVAKLVGSGNIL